MVELPTVFTPSNIVRLSGVVEIDRPLHWFESMIGQLVYFPEDGGKAYILESLSDLNECGMGHYFVVSGAYDLTGLEWEIS